MLNTNFFDICAARVAAKAAADEAAAVVAAYDEQIKAAMAAAGVDSVATPYGVVANKAVEVHRMNTAKIKADAKAGSPFARAVLGRFYVLRDEMRYSAPRARKEA